MKNNKGFTLVEILAAVTILGILSILAIGGYTRYSDYARRKSHDTMAKSVSNAAEQFIMDNPGAAVETYLDGDGVYRITSVDTAPGISFADLVEENYLNSVIDPDNKDMSCSGTVRIGLVESAQKDALDRYIFVVDECCSIYQARYTYTYVDTYEEKDGETKLKTVFKEIKDRNHTTCS